MNIKTRIEMSGKSIYEISKEAMIPQPNINKLLKGNTALANMSFASVYRLAKTLDCSMEDMWSAVSIYSKIVWQEGWNEIYPGFDVWMEDGILKRGIKGSDVNQRTVYPYKSVSDGATIIYDLTPKEAVRLDVTGRLSWL